MHLLEWTRKQTYGEEDFPLHSVQAKLALTVETAGTVPTSAVRRIAMRALKELLEEAHEEDLLAVASHAEEIPPPHLENGHGNGNGHGHNGTNGSWIQPAGLDLRIIKSAHRLILEVARRGESGRAVLASELVGAMGLSAPTIGRLLREGDPGADYIARFVNTSANGRTKAIDLKPEGRLLASKIRAGVVPV
jgi:hypothetical protein